MEIPRNTTSDHSASTQEVHLALQWFTEEQGHQLLSRWAEVPSSPSYLVMAQVQHQPTDNPLDKDSESSSLVLLLDLSAPYDC